MVNVIIVLTSLLLVVFSITSVIAINQIKRHKRISLAKQRTKKCSEDHLVVFNLTANSYEYDLMEIEATLEQSDRRIGQNIKNSNITEPLEQENHFFNRKLNYQLEYA